MYTTKNILDWNFWQTWLKDEAPQAILQALRDKQDLSLLPELLAIIGVPQDPKWHPEGDVWTHTLLVCQQARKIVDREKLKADDQVVLMLAALCHDLGKAQSTIWDQGRWRSPQHAIKGVEVSERFLKRISCPEPYIEQVLPLVREHLAYSSFTKASVRAMRRLVERLSPARFEQLDWLIEADHSARPPLPPKAPEELLEMRKLWQDIKDHKPMSGLIKGRHLLQKGLKPGPHFRQLIDECAKAQAAGKFSDLDAGLQYLEKLLSKYKYRT